ncbi:MAG: AAA family ATPase, partial [Chloroflexota bacterium]
GEVGIGKSHLLEAFVHRQTMTTGSAPRLLMGQGYKLQTNLPYHPLIEALRSLPKAVDWASWLQTLEVPPIWQREITRLIPELDQDAATISQATDEIRLWEGITQLLFALSRQTSLILVLDDLHWADTATLGLLGYLVRRIEQDAAKITIVSAARPTEVTSSLQGLITTLKRENHLGYAALGPLNLDELTAWAKVVSPDQAPALADWLIEKTEGNPLFVTELLHFIREQRLIVEGQLDISRLLEMNSVPDAIMTLIRSRLAQLSEATRQLLGAMAILGREFAFDVLAHLTDLSEIVVLDSLDELISYSFILPLPQARYRIDHPLTLQVVLADLSEPRQRLYHRLAAQALETIYPQALEPMAGLLVYHFSAAGQQDKAATYAFMAGQQARNLAAWQQAIDFYEQALVLVENLKTGSTSASAAVPSAVTLLSALGKACTPAGNYARGIEALQTALDLVHRNNEPSDDKMTIYSELSIALIYQGRHAEILTLADEIERDSHPMADIAAKFCRGLALAQSGIDLDQAVLYLRQAESLLEQSDLDPLLLPDNFANLASIKFELGNIFAKQGDLQTAVQLYREGIQFTDDKPALFGLHTMLYNNLAYHLHLLGQTEAETYAQTGLTLAQESGILSVQPYLFSTLGEIALDKQAFNQAETYFKEGLSLAQRFSSPDRIIGLTANLGRVSMHQQDRDSAFTYYTTALAEAERLNHHFQTAQIQLWLIPLLPAPEARAALEKVRQIAKQHGYKRLFDEIHHIEKS